jgi:hypothetical protein
VTDTPILQTRSITKAFVATVVTVFALQVVLSIAPVSRDVLEAFVALFAVVLLVWVSFWLISRLEHKRWMEFLRSRVWTAVSLGSAASLILIGFTAVYREGFETVLFYQALADFGNGLSGWIALFARRARPRRGRGDLPPGQTRPDQGLRDRRGDARDVTIAFLGTPWPSCTADRILTTPLPGWPRPIYVAEATGYRPTVQTVVVSKLAFLPGRRAGCSS